MAEQEKKRSSTEIDVEGASILDAGQVSTFQTAHSDNPLFVPDLTYTAAEESKIIRTLDTRLFPWILLTTFVLNMDRTNHSNAVSDNLPADLGFTIDTVNTGTAIYSVLFSCFCFSGAVMAKIVGPARCMLLWTYYFNNRGCRDTDSHVLVGTRYNGSCFDSQPRRVSHRLVVSSAPSLV